MPRPSIAPSTNSPYTYIPGVISYTPQRELSIPGGVQDGYTDDGCEVSSSCLSCPLPACRFEVPIYQQLARFWKATTIRIAAKTGEPINAVAYRVFGKQNKNIYTKGDKPYAESDYAFNPYLVKLWEAGYRSGVHGATPGRPSHDLSRLLQLEAPENVS